MWRTGRRSRRGRGLPPRSWPDSQSGPADGEGGWPDLRGRGRRGEVVVVAALASCHGRPSLPRADIAVESHGVVVASGQWSPRPEVDGGQAVDAEQLRISPLWNASWLMRRRRTDLRLWSWTASPSVRSEPDLEIVLPTQLRPRVGEGVESAPGLPRTPHSQDVRAGSAMGGEGPDRRVPRAGVIASWSRSGRGSLPSGASGIGSSRSRGGGWMRVVRPSGEYDDRRWPILRRCFACCRRGARDAAGQRRWREDTP